MYALPDAIHFVFGGWNFVPVLVLSFIFAFLGHVVMDWKANIGAKKKKIGQVDCFDESPNSVLGSIDGSRIMDEPQQEKDEAPSIDTIQTHALTMDSTAGRPSFEEILSLGEELNDNSEIINGISDTTGASTGATNTGVFLCGPEAMVQSCKKIARVTGKKVVVYEEKFSW